MKARIWTVPNQITFLRLGFLPVFLMLIAYDRYRWALLVLVVSGLSDGFDGLLARSLNQRSALGAYLDPSPINFCSLPRSSCWRSRSNWLGGSLSSF